MHTSPLSLANCLAGGPKCAPFRGPLGNKKCLLSIHSKHRPRCVGPTRQPLRLRIPVKSAPWDGQGRYILWTEVSAWGPRRLQPQHLATVSPHRSSAPLDGLLISVELPSLEATEMHGGVCVPSPFPPPPEWCRKLHPGLLTKFLREVTQKRGGRAGSLVGIPQTPPPHSSDTGFSKQ